MGKNKTKAFSSKDMAWKGCHPFCATMYACYIQLFMLHEKEEDVRYKKKKGEKSCFGMRKILKIFFRTSQTVANRDDENFWTFSLTAFTCWDLSDIAISSFSYSYAADSIEWRKKERKLWKILTFGSGHIKFKFNFHNFSTWIRNICHLRSIFIAFKICLFRLVNVSMEILFHLIWIHL